jgi:hypothetical protein
VSSGIVTAFSTLRWWTKFDRFGTLIHHAVAKPPATIGTLVVVMIQPPRDALQMAPVGGPILPAQRMTAVLRAAITPWPRLQYVQIQIIARQSELWQT